jgi:hypothetical protein
MTVSYVYITVLNAIFSVLYTPHFLFMMKRDMSYAYFGYKIFAIPESTHEHCIINQRDVRKERLL